MTIGAVSARAQELAAEGTAYVVATVVRAQRPTSVKAGDAALVLADGTIEGFVGGVCTQQSVRAYSLKAIETGEALLLRILPDGSVDDEESLGLEVATQEGAVTIQNPCLSGGAIELFLEPVLPAPRVLVVGDTPIAAAIRSLGPELELNLVAVDGGAPEPAAGDLALVVASHGRDELHMLRRGLEARCAVHRPRGEPEARRRRDRRPARRRRARGAARADRRARRPRHRRPDPGRDRALDPRDASSPCVAASACRVRPDVARRPGSRRCRPAPLAIDPICGMTVAAVESTPSLQVDGETVYFCCEGCATEFEERQRHAVEAS